MTRYIDFVNQINLRGDYVTFACITIVVLKGLPTPTKEEHR